MCAVENMWVTFIFISFISFSHIFLVFSHKWFASLAKFIPKKAMTNLDSILKSKDTKGLYSQSYGFSSSHVPVWELDHKGGWAPKNWCFQSVLLEKTLKSSLHSKKIYLK